MKTVKLGKKEVYNFSEPYIVVDIGSNHNGDMRLCKKMIDAAVRFPPTKANIAHFFYFFYEYRTAY